MDEPFNLVQILLLGPLALSAIVVALLGHLGQTLQQLCLGDHHLYKVKWRWRWRFLLTVVPASTPLLWRSLCFMFSFGLGLLVLLLIRRLRSTSSLGLTLASTDNENRCLALSTTTASRLSVFGDGSLLLSSFFEAIHQTVGSRDGHLLENIRKKYILVLGVRHIVRSINTLKCSFYTN